MRALRSKERCVPSLKLFVICFQRCFSLSLQESLFTPCSPDNENIQPAVFNKASSSGNHCLRLQYVRALFLFFLFFFHTQYSYILRCIGTGNEGLPELVVLQRFLTVPVVNPKA